LNIQDFPGSKEFREEDSLDVEALRQCSSLIFVMDAHDSDKELACNKFFDVIKVAYKLNPSIMFEVFIHKVDPDLFTQDEQKFDTLNEVSLNMQSLLREFGLSGDGQGEDGNNFVRLHYNLTSIYDLTIFQALSQVIQKMLPQVQFITQLLDQLVKSS
jgi:Ras-related GTP-binding protein C/D